MVSRLCGNAFCKWVKIIKKASAKGADSGAGSGTTSTKINILVTDDEAGTKMRMRFEYGAMASRSGMPIPSESSLDYARGMSEKTMCHDGDSPRAALW